jgi:tetratricopeptide (TPR) repeat protein
MLNQAENDLESYRKNLPEEAILEKCFCYMELAGLQKRLPKSYDFSKVLSYLKNAIALYHENALFVDEHICRMTIMDELCAIENVDKDYKLTKPEEMQMQLNAIKIFLPLLEEHPVLAEFYLRLSFYCIHLDDYDKCALYYNKFRNTLVSLEHFAPWLHRYHMVTSFVVRTIYFKKAIEKIKESKEIVKYVPEVQEWFKAYPNHDGMITSMLLGKSLDIPR